MKEEEPRPAQQCSMNHDHAMGIFEQASPSPSDVTISNHEDGRRHAARSMFTYYLANKWEHRETKEEQDAWRTLRQRVSRLEQQYPDVFDEVMGSRGKAWAQRHIVQDYTYAFAEQQRQRESGEHRKIPVFIAGSRERKDHRRLERLFPGVHEAALQEISELRRSRPSVLPDQQDQQGEA